jgi:hypothetical protein
MAGQSRSIAPVYRLDTSVAGNEHIRADPTPHGRVAEYPGRVLTQRQVVDYALQRRALLADVYAGRVGTAAVCDAGPYLLRAARFHGIGTEQQCPVCRKERLTQVWWVFGEELKHVSGSARNPAEVEELAGRFGEFSAHLVEVCRTCGWNHLVQSSVLGTGARPDRPRRRRTAGD